ncbi:hypothetical protein FisN_4Lh420 [Fistulifera solaris]|uniref:Uncharacterized protein n=1 Tax=Fistulifera solaris TaxID=1519565 RepID=A0A1Z5KDN7_FISSO|nr:hypothetical protein FisN_4Lh420 [Fistulifera solaris]|eukprot:GAX24306.1 hypothetical protein FisN_4Lh420 [Fistulifera solaris]
MNQGDNLPEPSVDMFYSLYSWFSIFVLHALLHLWMAGKCKQQNQYEMTTNEIADTGISMAKQKVFDSFSERDLHQSSSSLDGDEPSIFYELLAQTGSEMTTTYSRENLVREQLQMVH